MKEIAIDASVSAAWILPDESTPASERLLAEVLAERVRLVVPALWEYEMLNILRGSVARRRMDVHGAKRALHLLSQIPMETVPLDSENRSAVLDVCVKHGLSAYDAAYVVLADVRGISLISADKDILSLRSHFSWIKAV